MPSSPDALRHFRPPVPDQVSRRAAAWPTGVAAMPATPSASVVLVRDAAATGTGLEVYLLHRHARMPFAPLMAVFPGGRLDPVDTGSGDVEEADPLRACAVRETEEETGVRLEPADLYPWAHWVTPETEPLRFDTFFYVAVLPDGAVARDVSGETERAAWVTVSDALAQRETGELSLMPPTWAILAECLAFADSADVLAAARGRVVETVLPRVVRVGTDWAYAYGPAPEVPA